MYSPKISKDLIQELYRMSRRENLPMTKLVDKMLREAIERYKGTNAEFIEEQNQMGGQNPR
jgi:hypothetical protein